MILGSHNAWSFNRPKKWWMRLLAFTSRCQDLSIREQYEYGVRCFDLRLRFVDTVNGYDFAVVHGPCVYHNDLLSDLEFLNDKGDVSIRVILDVRSEKQKHWKNTDQVSRFMQFCNWLNEKYTKIKFWYGRMLFENTLIVCFSYKPSCIEKYASVCTPKLIDDWYPRWFAKNNNERIKSIECKDNQILLIDFVNIG